MKLGDRVRNKANPKQVGTIIGGPILNGGDWYVEWDDLKGIQFPEYCVDLELVEGQTKAKWA